MNRSKKIEDALEPLELIDRAIRIAIEDTGISGYKAQALQASIDSLEIVRSWTWPYPDLPGLVAKRLNIKPRRSYYSDHGGNTPGKLFDGAARRISLGETKVALLGGGEALASCTKIDRSHVINILSDSLAKYPPVQQPKSSPLPAGQR